MIERYVLLKLRDEFTSTEARRAVAEHSKKVLTALPQVLDVRVGISTDIDPGSDWDLSLAVRLESQDDLAPYSADPQHRAYVDEYLKPKLESIRAWNFTIAD